MLFSFMHKRDGVTLLSFQDLLQRFNVARDSDGASLLQQYKEGTELTESLIWELLKGNLDLYPSSSADFNILVNAFIIQLAGGDPAAWLSKDPEAEFFLYNQEIQDNQLDVERDPLHSHAVKFWTKWKDKNDG